MKLMQPDESEYAGKVSHAMVETPLYEISHCFQGPRLIHKVLSAKNAILGHGIENKQETPIFSWNTWDTTWDTEAQKNRRSSIQGRSRSAVENPRRRELSAENAASPHAPSTRH